MIKEKHLPGACKAMYGDDDVMVDGVLHGDLYHVLHPYLLQKKMDLSSSLCLQSTNLKKENLLTSHNREKCNNYIFVLLQ